MTARGARQAIPPAYTEWIGRELLESFQAGVPSPTQEESGT